MLEFLVEVIEECVIVFPKVFIGSVKKLADKEVKILQAVAKEKNSDYQDLIITAISK